MNRPRHIAAAVVGASALIAFAVVSCQATTDPLDNAPPPSITPALVQVTASPTRTPVPTATPLPTATPRPTATPAATATPRPGATATPEATAPRATPTSAPTATSVPAATASPTHTPAPEPTPTPAPTATPEPDHELDVLTFIFDLGANPRNAQITRVASETWSDLSLGCETDDGNVPAVTVDGYIYHVSADGNDYVFHVADYGDETVVVNCTEMPAVETETLNPVDAFGLAEATSMTFWRTDGEGGYDRVRVVEASEDVAKWVAALDADLPIGAEETCETAFRMEFHIGSESVVIDFFCADDWYRVGGEQAAWQRTQGTMPATVLDLVAPILSDQPLPPVPALEEEEPATPTPTP